MQKSINRIQKRAGGIPLALFFLYIYAFLKYTENDKKEKWKSSHFSFLFLQILNYKVFKIYHKKHQKARVNLKHLAGTIPSIAARWSARFPDHLPESSSFLIKRAAKSPAEKGKMKVPPKSPQRGTFFECP